MVGGCCGTTARAYPRPGPEGGRAEPGAAVKERSHAAARRLRCSQPRNSGCSPAPLIIGEQTNATRQPQVQGGAAGRRPGRHAGRRPGTGQEGAHLLDLNVAYAGRDEARDMERAAAQAERPQSACR